MLYVTSRFVAFVAIVVLGALILAAPNVMSPAFRASLPDWWPKDTISLGLDLRGGSYLLLEIDMAQVKTDRLETLVGDVRRALREARIGYTGLGREGQTVRVTISDAAAIPAAREALRDLSSPIGGLLGGGGESITLDEDVPGQFALAYSEAQLNEYRQQTVIQSIEIVRKRVDELGNLEAAIQQQGADRILVQVPGLDDPQELIALLGKTAKMTFRLVDVSVPMDEALAGRVPPGSELLDGETTGPDGKPVRYLVQKRVMVSGENLTNAQQTINQQTGEVVVSFQFDLQGARRFGDVTRENVGRPFAIVLDDKVISAPVIREAITGGQGQISGNFTVTEANNLAILLRAGALPAPLNVVETRTVGAELGADSIAAGQVAAIVGMLAVVVFMVLAYGLFGVFAVVALTVNIILIFATMTLLGSVLTLPGIAGIVLTIGMAVDANVLIYERMKEEAALGKPAISAMDSGFARAFATILDSNLTTILAVGLLLIFGSGPIRGFSIALSIGIISSFFTAMTLTRLMVIGWVRATRPKVLPI
ncbi:MAG: protein translocase subunit SecD [Alphaproteobacteria bacterium]|nr:protein translocase subunit SecD [Alphaproteobacteria bacterium]